MYLYMGHVRKKSLLAHITQKSQRSLLLAEGRVDDAVYGLSDKI